MFRCATILIGVFGVAVSAVGLASALNFDASNYTITNIGGVDANWSGSPSVNFQGYSLTDSGLVTGYGHYGWRGSDGPPPIPVTYLGQWKASTGFVPLYNTGDTGFEPYLPAMGNDSGIISYTTWSTPYGHLWTSSGGSTVTPGGPAGGLINSSGLAAGGDWLNATTGAAYDTVTHTSYTLPGVAMAINNLGQVGGSTSGWGSGFVWTKNTSTYWGAAGTTTTLSGFGEVESLSPDGRYAGGTNSTWSNAVLYDAQTHTYLNTFTTPGEIYTIAANGWIGGDTDGTGGFGGMAWLWDGTTLHDLNTELQAKFTSALSGLTVCACMAINSSNQILVWGTNSSQYPETFVLTPHFPGDANIDGKVDIADLSIVLTNYDKGGMTWSQGDFDGSGTVDINDLSKVLTNYDKSQSASVGVQAVPEPGTIGLLVAGSAFLLPLVRRKRT